LARL
jgi:hypothetical protein